MKEIEALLRQTMGLHAPTIGAGAIERAARGRMVAHELTNKATYLELLRHSPAEWNALVEAVAVTETWFFRDQEAFRALANLALQEWLPSHPTGGLKLLSMPCSTGEEPYSMAMALFDAGFSEGLFQIDAVDIRSDAVAHAQCAEYGKNSFRTKDLGFRAHYFRAMGKSWILKANVRSRVQFEVGNILDAQCLAQIEAYDFIFCRNLLIYFDGPTQTRVLGKLSGLLKPDGFLFLGAAEVPVAVNHGFVAAQLPLSFCCRKAQKAVLPAAAPKFETEIIHRETQAKLPRAAPTADLNKARRLANEGRLFEAERICEQYLREGGVSAEAYYLLGLAHDATGAELEASEFYRKALYLEPNHYETMLQWASLSEKTGNDAHARLLNERAARVKRGIAKSR